MATIMVHQKSGARYVLLGTGFGAYQSKKPNWFFGDWVADTTQGQYPMICVCDKAGQIGWFDSASLTVESIDGEQVSEAF